MLCSVFRSLKKPETYLYRAHGFDFGDLPADLQQVFGEPQHVMGLRLSPQRKLAQVDVNTVLKSLKESGYFLQLPPKTPTEEAITGWLSR